jgi:hypothetical protein
MIVLNPWALIGLAAIAAPIAVHLLARRQAKRQPFPTLRFVPLARLAPVRRDRLTDLGLLTLRCAVIAVAVSALAQPACPARDHAGDLGSDLARAIVIDTSASMTREAAPGMTAADAARRQGADLSASATIARIVESESPADLITASAAWLATLSMRREVVLVSDFQTGQFDGGDLARIPNGIGVRPVPIPVRGAIPLPVAAAHTESVVTLLAGPDEQSAAEAAWQAAVARGAPVTRQADRPVAIVFPRYETRGTLIANGRPLEQPWMFDLIAEVSGDSLSYLYSNGLSWTGGTLNGRAGVLLMANVAPDSLEAAALVAATARAAAGAPPAAELSPDVVPADELARWTREASATGSARIGDAAPQGRWLWVAVLVLLLVEGVVRRTGTKMSEDHVERAA